MTNKNNIKPEKNFSRIRSLERKLDRIIHIMGLIRTVVHPADIVTQSHDPFKYI